MANVAALCNYDADAFCRCYLFICIFRDVGNCSREEEMTSTRCQSVNGKDIPGIQTQYYQKTIIDTDGVSLECRLYHVHVMGKFTEQLKSSTPK